jgi:hypothetical protein
MMMSVADENAKEALARLKRASDELDAAQKASRTTVREITRAEKAGRTSVREVTRAKRSVAQAKKLATVLPPKGKSKG